MITGINESTTLSFLEKLLPPDVTLSIGCVNGLWTVALVRVEGTVLTGTGQSIIQATRNLLLWLAPTEKRCPHCGEFDLHKLWGSRTSWKCVTCGKDYLPDSARRVLSDPWAVESLEEIKLFLEQNPKHPVCSGWSDLICEVEHCGEEFCLEVFQEELHRVN